LPLSSAWRAPRLLVLANGAPLGNATETAVSTYGGFAAGVWRVRAALAGDTARWAASTAVDVDIQLMLDPLGGFVSLMQGSADYIGIDPIAGTLTLEGRDRSAALIEARTQETFANRTSSEIAATLASRHGLAADVQATTTPVGRFWQLEHDALTMNAHARATTEWDLLATLAGWEGFDLWVTGSTLHFRPPDTLALPAVLAAAPTAAGAPDFTALRLERALSFAGDIVVTVKSWHSRLGAGTVQTAQTARGSGAQRDYVFVVPNLSPDAALLLAQRKLAELASHELVFRGEMPGELVLSPRVAVQLIGTGTVFDTGFRIDEIERRISMRAGFSQLVQGRTASPF